MGMRLLKEAREDFWRSSERRELDRLPWLPRLQVDRLLLPLPLNHQHLPAVSQHMPAWAWRELEPCLNLPIGEPLHHGVDGDVLSECTGGCASPRALCLLSQPLEHPRVRLVLGGDL